MESRLCVEVTVAEKIVGEEVTVAEKIVGEDVTVAEKGRDVIPIIQVGTVVEIGRGSVIHDVERHAGRR